MDTREKYARYVNTSFVKAIEPVVVERAAGAEICGADGQIYLDCFAGIAVVNAGHVHPRVAEAATGKREIIALQMAFHGRTYGTLSVTGNMARKTRGGPYMSGVAFAPAPYCYRCPLKLEPESCGLACADAVEDVIHYQTSGDVAAFIVEPALGEGGLIPLPEGYLARVKEILDRHGILLIVDEVQTGFGRTGKLFGIDHHEGIEPDMIAMAIGIADGFPLGAFIAPEAIADSFLPGEHLSTFGGN